MSSCYLNLRLSLKSLFLAGLVFFCLGVSPKSKVCFKDTCFSVEVAKTLGQRVKGLKFRKYLPEKEAMLLVFAQEDIQSIWMKDTLIPPDIIWINNEKRIVHIDKNVQPCKKISCPSITNNKKVRYVLEINAGLSNKLGIKPGKILTFVP